MGGLGKLQEQSEADLEKQNLREQLVALKEKHEKMEALVNFLEEEKLRLQEKLDKAMVAGEHLLDSELRFMHFPHGLFLRFQRERAGAGAGVDAD